MSLFREMRAPIAEWGRRLVVFSVWQCENKRNLFPLFERQPGLQTRGREGEGEMDNRKYIRATKIPGENT